MNVFFFITALILTTALFGLFFTGLIATGAYLHALAVLVLLSGVFYGAAMAAIDYIKDLKAN